jgi:UDP-N-acetylmuramate: L-alanyl-gamma-D-glutamyl-meso-diaminopimelate ligase
LTLLDILDRVDAAGVSAQGIEDTQAFLNQMPANLKGDEVVLLLSSGPLDGLADTLPNRLDTLFGDRTDN